ncbi:MAG: hypothetical protein GPJ51_15620 [Candidatus Heimdallarchaeota archaeon]|nr:hypothetical protein [Candidatus Heimdallarchaeota archaeon]
MSFEENKQYEEEKKEESQFTSELQDAIEEQREEIVKQEPVNEKEPEPEPEPEPEEVKEETVAPVKAAPPVEEKKKKEERISYSHIDVDLWRTKMHKEEWGIRLDAQRAQKDRQWTRDMDAIGTVKVDGEDYGLLAIRENLWKGKDPLERRFVMKLFSPSGYWRASIERLQGESFANSHATKEPCPAYVCIFKHTRNLFRIRRLSHFPRFQGQIFGFSYLDENDKFQSFVIDDKRLRLGSDWVIKNIHNKVIAKINGKFLNVGGRFKIDIFEEKLAKDKTFYNMLILFSSTLRFYRNIKKNIKKSLKELKISDTEVKLDDSESNLYLNPRKLSI